MSSTTLSLHPATMATKPLTSAACYEFHRPAHEKSEAELHPLRMDWHVINDANGNRRLQMRWRAN